MQKLSLVNTRHDYIALPPLLVYYIVNIVRMRNASHVFNSQEAKFANLIFKEYIIVDDFIYFVGSMDNCDAYSTIDQLCCSLCSVTLLFI